MNPLLEQFLSESRDFLQSIGDKLMRLESAPTDQDLINELFRLVHTLKGNSGLFEFPEMTRVLHAGEDLMVAIRTGRAAYSQEVADRLLDVMDFVGMLCDEVEATGVLGTSQSSLSAQLAAELRHLTPAPMEAPSAASALSADPGPMQGATNGHDQIIDAIPEAARLVAYREAQVGDLLLVDFKPDANCFYQGADPFRLAMQTPGLLGGGILAREPWARLEELDAYHCVLDYCILTDATRAELEEHFRWVPEQISLTPVSPIALARPQGDPNGGPVYEDFVSDAIRYLNAGDLNALERATKVLLELSNPNLWLSSALRWLLAILAKEPDLRVALRAVIESLTTLQPPDWMEIQHQAGAVVPAAMSAAEVKSQGPLNPAHASLVAGLLGRQREILALGDGAGWQPGRVQAAAATVGSCLRAGGDLAALASFETALATALATDAVNPLLAWLDRYLGSEATAIRAEEVSPTLTKSAPEKQSAPDDSSAQSTGRADGEPKYGRRAEDSLGPAKSLKVDQVKIDRLMNLIGEMVVSKNALPYLAGRAENVFGVRELSREIKTQYAVINRITDEMQDAIMQVRMMPVSFVFQRFPRLVRDTSRKLGKDVNLVLVGEDTEADKNIIEALGDPLVHIVRNSLDHGFELPDVRKAAGKPVTGSLTITASQESDRVLIEIQDDGKGIDPVAIKQKAYERGLIDEATVDRLSDQEAIQLIFAPGLSTAEKVSDLSGRGVGMDVVRTVIENLNGSIHLESVLGKGTRLCLSLPLSMAVTNVVIIEADGQSFGIPMDRVVETVRIPRKGIWTIKDRQVTVLRGRTMALKSLNELLGIVAAPKLNEDGEQAVIVVRLGDEQVGLVVDSFHETVDVILKPMTGILSGLAAFSGSALMGDGSVLIVLNIKEIL